MPTVGICRGLHAYIDFDEWACFLEALGCDVHLSAPTSRSDLELGVRMAPAELCLPVKAFLGQVVALSPNVDFVMLPRVVCRIAGGRPFFGCPKSLALPDLVRALIPDIRNGLELLIDERRCGLRESFMMLARSLSCSRTKALQAWSRCSQARAEGVDRARQQDYPQRFLKGADVCCEDGFVRFLPRGGLIRRVTVGVVAHPYLVLDRLLSLDLIESLRQLGITVLLPVPATPTDLVSTGAADPCGGLFLSRTRVWPDWLYETALLAAAERFVRNPAVGGLLLVSSFACGTAAVVNEIIRRDITALRSLPVLTILLDEHTSPAGLATRLESFSDILARGYDRVSTPAGLGSRSSGC